MARMARTVSLSTSVHSIGHSKYTSVSSTGRRPSKYFASVTVSPCSSLNVRSSGICAFSF